MADAKHPIRMAACRTGLSEYVIRVWEQRYGAVRPERTGTRRRLYSEAEIDRLRLLRDLTRAGHGIGQVARLPTADLRVLAAEAMGVGSAAKALAAGEPTAERLREEGLAAIRMLEARALGEVLQRGATALGGLGLLHRVIAPLTRSLGELWRSGELTASHEHFATGVIRVFLGNAVRPFAAVDSAPVLVVATPAGQLHELGALLAGAAASHLGWQVLYLGASLPAAEIAGAARQSGARAVALSVVYPEDDARLGGELTRLRELLPEDVALLVGGRALPACRPALGAPGILPVEDLAHLGSTLDTLRQTNRKAAA